MWPFDKNKKVDETAAEQLQEIFSGAPPKFTDEDKKRMDSLDDERKFKIKEGRLKQFSDLSAHMRQLIIDQIKMKDFRNKFHQVDIPITEEYNDLSTKRQLWEQYAMVAGISAPAGVMGPFGHPPSPLHHSMAFMTHVHHPTTPVILPNGEFNFLSDAGLTLEDLEKIHMNNTAHEELLDTDTKD